MQGTFTFLGSGTSRGVPMMCCSCEVCRSTDPRDHHDRSAGLVTIGKTRILIDCGPDLRAELVREHVTRLDAVLLTHPHADHLHGIDDLQGITQYNRLELPFYAAPATLDMVRKHFDYIDVLKYQDDGSPQWAIPQLAWRPITGPFEINGVPVIPLPLFHGRAATLGFRIGHFAYICDCSRIPENTYPLLDGVTNVVIDALRWKAHPTHFCIAQAEAEVRKIHAPRAWFTHLTHDVLYARDQPLMQPGNTLAYDGLRFPFEL